MLYIETPFYEDVQIKKHTINTNKYDIIHNKIDFNFKLNLTLQKKGVL